MLPTLLALSLLTPPDSLPTRYPGRADSVLLNEVIVVSASRTAERLMRSPVSIDVLDSRSIRLSAQPSYYDAIENLKGVQLLTPSLGFKVYNARGFANPTNVRFVQLVDGRDNQAPHIGAPIAGALAPSDLDIQRVELVPGAASALYGMNALNGLINLLTKNPFTSTGLSVSQKTGVNHVAEAGSRPQVFSETSLRYAARLGTSWAFKINLSYQRGYDWIASDATDLSPSLNASLGLTGADNPARDPVSSYGNESANRRTLSLNGRNYVVARTGYYEAEVTDYRLSNLAGSVAVHYRPSRNTELAYVYQGSWLDNVYQRTNRFRLENYRLDQHSLTFTSPSVQLRAYRTSENTGQSYNLRSMAENIDRSFKSDNTWFADFSQQFRSSVAAGASVTDALQAARNRADQGRPQPGTPAFDATIARLRDINNWDIGAALRVQSWLYHVEGQIEPTQKLWARFRQQTGVELLAGFDYRTYVVFPDGNYFINPTEPGNNLIYTKAGGFVQATRAFFADRLKLTGTWRVDKNAYFNARLNPRVSVVYSPVQSHNIRASYQTGYRFPSLFEAFSNVNSGGVKRVGGLPLLAQGIFETSYFRTSIDAFQAAINTDVNVNKLTTQQAIEKNKGLLKPNTYTYIKPEEVNAVEVGYKGLVAGQRLFIDADFYYSTYRNFIAQVEANVPRTNVPDSIPFALADRTKQDRYRLWTNSRTVVRNYGASLGLRYALGKSWIVSGNATYAQLDRTDSGDGLEEAFNTPRWIANVGLANSQLLTKLGASINYKYQSAFLWQSSLATGMVPAFHTVDAQVTYRLAALGVTAKLGATNLFNRPYTTFVAGPSVGGFYYTTLVWGL
ncbi:TonB-dependent receptor [Fibrella aestuarina BUZ 2]|uniref:TonB-dependent receptor n=1 Tax=Fibrella aestuarina BUZ 2 TaxID=1166018 RepID=I0KD94_9BACT|nr:TonB-dependent receptor [Fibrella aestuarina]CCH02097.1 TonB-dependent receptor [Fibrella aestuarina BUZ 2]